MRIFPKSYKKRGLLGALLLLLGGTLLIVMLILHTDYSTRQTVFHCVFGALLVFFGVLMIRSANREAKTHEMDFSADFARTGETVPEPLTEQFKTDYAAFFAADGIGENSPVQNETTQLFKNGLDRHKRRLDRLGIRMEFRSAPRQYTEPPVEKTDCFDGKYEITDIDEQVEAKRRYTKDGKTLFVRTNEQTAHYTVLDAKRVGESGTVICPSCGHETSREELIDGCEYCGTRFTVEDLGRKISAFSFRDRYDIAHARYKNLRLKYADRVILGVFLVLYFLILFCFAVLLTDEPGSGDVMHPFFFWTLSFVGMGAIFAAVLEMPFMAFYMLVIFPLLNISASFKYNSKRRLKALREAEAADEAFAETVRAADPLFSAADLMTNVQNKLSSVIFASNAAEINTFARIDLSPLLKRYENVFDLDFDRITFTEFAEEDGLRRIGLTAEVRLFTWNGKKVKNRRENIRMQLVRDAACNTRAVCAPSVMRCKSCGGSLSFAEGLACPYCGTRAELVKYDWVIDGFDRK